MVAKAGFDECQGLRPGWAFCQPAIVDKPGELEAAFSLQFIMVQHRVGLIDIVCCRVRDDPLDIGGQVVQCERRDLLLFRRV